MQGHRQAHGQDASMGGHHQGNRHFGQGEGVGHGGQSARSSDPLFGLGTNPATALALAVTALDPQGPARQRWPHALGLLSLSPEPVPPGSLPPVLSTPEPVVISQILAISLKQRALLSG